MRVALGSPGAVVRKEARSELGLGFGGWTQPYADLHLLLQNTHPEVWR